MSKVSRTVVSLSAGGLLAASPALVGCAPSGASAEPRGYTRWAETDGAAGRINMDDVQLAFQTSTSATDFETRVNEIYEGDGLILVRVRQEEKVFTLEGWEDLDGNSKIEDAVDDHLFSVVRHEDESHELVGHHGNSYYRSSFGAGEFLLFYMLAASITPGPAYYYQTPVDRTPAMRYQRDSYRGSSRHSTQLDSNRQYSARQQTYQGSKYQSSARNLSMNRSTYQSVQKTTGAFRGSGAVTGGRSTSISRGVTGTGSSISRGGASFGGARGGGGGLNLRSAARGVGWAS